VKLLLLGPAAVALAFAAGSADGHPAARTGDEPWRPLRRPLHLPQVAPGAACPTSSGRHAREYSRLFGSAFALGPGPVYPVIDSSDPGAGEATVPYRRRNVGGWHAFKVRWIAAPGYAGQALVRGRQLDGSNRIRFRLSGVRVELHLNRAVDPGRWRGWPSEAEVTGPGCFGMQIDGQRFSRVVVFRAEPASS
jgi:hypothetical protein